MELRDSDDIIEQRRPHEIVINRDIAEISIRADCLHHTHRPNTQWFIMMIGRTNGSGNRTLPIIQENNPFYH